MHTRLERRRNYAVGALLVLLGLLLVVAGNAWGAPTVGARTATEQIRQSDQMNAADGEGATAGATRFVISIDSVSNFAYRDSGAFNTPVGAGSPGPAMPGSVYEWTFTAAPGDRLSFATMLVQSNDWFFAPDELGIPLYQNGAPVSGDVSGYVKVWDAGTEIDQPPGMGPDQAPRQAGPNTGAADSNSQVRQVFSAELPPADQLVQATLTPAGNGRFTLRLENISGSSSFPGPISPGVGVVHNNPAPLFVNGQPDRGWGLEALAEDGNPAPLAQALRARTGVNTPLAPVAYVVHEDLNPLFTPGQPASAGLETLAEDGSPARLVPELGANGGAATMGRGAGAAGPIMPPQGNYTFEIMAMPGDHLSLATMFVQSNDWFYALNNQPLFTANGLPISGNVTHEVALWDAGTEVDAPPGIGQFQAPRQPAPDTGPAEGGVIMRVTDPAFASPVGVIHVTITPVQ